MSFLDKLKSRRSIYALGRNVNTDNSTIESVIKEAIRNSPSSFNSQSSRAVILFNGEHEAFWQIVEDTLRAIVPADAFAATEAKINGFRAGHGTVLFFEDQDVVKGLQEKFAAYADNFPIWSEQASGIAQHAVWLALADHNIGASLQHYNPIIDEQTISRWNLPASWKLRAQMPFGSIEAPAAEKTFMDDAERFRVFA